MGKLSFDALVALLVLAAAAMSAAGWMLLNHSIVHVLESSSRSLLSEAANLPLANANTRDPVCNTCWLVSTPEARCLPRHLS